jgi:hypothetical protein
MALVLALHLNGGIAKLERNIDTLSMRVDAKPLSHKELIEKMRPNTP